MKITEDVIQDLLPMYLANEVSTDTRDLVDEYLKANPKLTHAVEEMNAVLNENVPIPLKKEDKLNAFIKIKRLQTIRIVVLSIVFSGLFLTLFTLIALLTRM